MMVNGCITKVGLSKSNVYPCWICCLRVIGKSLLCVKCGRRIHYVWCGVQRVAPKFSKNFACRKCEGNIDEGV